MPYNTTAIPPRKDPTGQTQLPLTRVKKIVAQDTDITICSNNAAFVITLATEMFVQHLAAEAHNMAKLERKPRRNVQYKDMASAVLHHDNLEFLVDVVPKTAPYKQVKAQVAASRAKLNAGPAAAAAASRSDGRAEDPEAAADMPTGKRSKSKASPRRPSLAALNGTPAGGESPVAIMVNGTSHPVEGPRAPGNSRQSVHVLGDDEPNALSHTESRQAHHDDGDVDMTG